MRNKWRKQKDDCLDGLPNDPSRRIVRTIFDFRNINFVHQLHDGTDGRVEMESLDVFRHLFNRLVSSLPQRLLISFKGDSKRKRVHLSNMIILFKKEPPDPIEKTGRPLHPLITPI